MAKPVTIEVSVNMDETINHLRELYEEIAELYDMIPEYRQHEADEVVERIKERTGILLTSKQTNLHHHHTLTSHL